MLYPPLKENPESSTLVDAMTRMGLTEPKIEYWCLNSNGNYTNHEKKRTISGETFKIYERTAQHAAISCAIVSDNDV